MWQHHLAGALIYIGQSGDAWLGGSALFMMSLGMGVPLLVVEQPLVNICQDQEVGCNRSHLSLV